MRSKGHLLQLAQKSIQRLRYLRTSPLLRGRRWQAGQSACSRMIFAPILNIAILQGSTGSEPIEVSIGKARASLWIDGRRTASFAVRRVDVLTRTGAEALAEEARHSRRPIMIAFERSSPEARALLRERRTSYAA